MIRGVLGTRDLRHDDDRLNSGQEDEVITRGR